MEEGWSTNVVMEKMKLVLQKHAVSIRADIESAALANNGSFDSNVSNRAHAEVLSAMRLVTFSKMKKITARTNWLKWLNNEILAVLPLVSKEKQNNIVLKILSNPPPPPFLL
jgi:membrane-associated HD superfamily phosphohydrolase